MFKNIVCVLLSMMIVMSVSFAVVAVSVADFEASSYALELGNMTDYANDNNSKVGSVKRDSSVECSTKVKATSNLFAHGEAKFSEEDNKVTVTYFVQSDKNMLNCEWHLLFDPSVLKFNPAYNYAYNLKGKPIGYNLMPTCVSDTAVSSVLNVSNASMGEIYGNCSSLDLYDISSKRTALVTATFDVIGKGDTTVHLDVKVMMVTVKKSDGQGIEDETVVVNYVDNVMDVSSIILAESAVYSDGYNPDAEATPTEPTSSEPASSEPTSSEPTSSEPTSSEPTSSEPASSEPTSSEPTSSEPASSEPTSSESASSEPTSSEPVSSEPTEDVSTEPTSTTDSGNTEPSASESTEDNFSDSTNSDSMNSESTYLDTSSSSDALNNIDSLDSTYTDDKISTPDIIVGDNGVVSTGSSSVAFAILIVIISATLILYFAWKKSID